MAYTLKSGSEGKFLEEKFVKWDEVGLVGPNQSPGSLWTWGQVTGGVLGLDNMFSKSSPVQVGMLTNWKSASGGMYHTVAVKTDGTLWAWGSNTYGQLGLGDRTHRSSPVQVGSLTNWKQVDTGYTNADLASVLAIKTDGTLWAWGRNYAAYGGPLGLGDTTNRSSPVQVGSLTNWKQVSTSGYCSAAIKTDGTLWAWGSIAPDGIGLTSSPIQVGSLTNWKYVECGYASFMALKTDGTLWGIGYNAYTGVLGLGDTIGRSSLTQVGSSTNWKYLNYGYQHVFAIKTDGTLWSWGNNSYGQLGLGDITHRSSPVQVGSLTNWKQVDAGYYHTSAIKIDGTLWAWGNNGSGQLGLSDTTSRSSPVQVGSLTNWSKVYTNAFSSIALKYNY